MIDIVPRGILLWDVLAECLWRRARITGRTSGSTWAISVTPDIRSLYELATRAADRGLAAIVVDRQRSAVVGAARAGVFRSRDAVGFSRVR